MGDIISFDDIYDRTEDVDRMDVGELSDLAAMLREKIAELDDCEPKDMYSEEYEEWGDAHEELEDMLDDVLDRLDALRG